MPGDAPSIQMAIEWASDGDTVLVGGVSMTENIDFLGKRIVVKGSQASLEPANPNLPVVTMSSGEPRGAELSNFYIHSGAAAGVVCNGTSPIIRDCYFTSRLGQGDIEAMIDLTNASGAVIENNEFSGEFAPYDVGAVIRLNDGCSNDTIAYNLVYPFDNGAVIACRDNVEGLLIHNNNLWAATSHGVLVEGSGSVDIRNNIIMHAPEYAVYCGVGCTSAITAEYNCVYDNGGTFNFTAGVGNFTDDPEFRHSDGYDFRLRTGSPCIDAGDPDPFYNDADGSRNDVGFLEYTEACCRSLGNVDRSLDQLVTMGDLTVLIDHLFISLTPLVCVEEGNVDLSADKLVTMGDLTVMIDYLFICLGCVFNCADLPY